MAKHKHQPSRFRKMTHSGLLYECEICWRYIIWVSPKGRPGYWRVA